MTINLELSWPPSVNDYWKPTVKAHFGQRTPRTKPRLYMTPAGKAFRIESLALIRRQLGTRYKAIEGRISMDVELHPPNALCDIDNYHKPILDALQFAAVYKNDRQVKDLHTLMRTAVKPGYVRLVITEME